MFRYRRYRVFLVFAVFAIFALYRFSSSGSSWSTAIERVQPGKNKGQDSAPIPWEPNPKPAQDTNRLELDIPAAKSPQIKQTPPPPVAPVSRPVETKSSALPSLDDDHVEQLRPTPAATYVDDFYATPPPIHWKKKSDHFPVPTESFIKLPTAKPKPIARVQFKFKPESSLQKTDRDNKLSTIRSVFKRSWEGYRRFAWLEDELRPVSNSSRNPFAGWGATLVDALDTLWIMGLKEEFDEAAKAVDQIDFTTTTRPDIPLFETTIRYLGGLLAAYDVSGGKYKNLLTKAEELAEILLSAFDTPNRMPETYYYWRPDFTSNPHRASNRAVLAEIGSLSMEFTHLAQLTGKHEYYDAIARITDNLEKFQKETRLPGMWPVYIDISGCKRIDYSVPYTKPLQNPIVDGPGKSPSKPPSIPPMKGPHEAPLSENPDFAVGADATFNSPSVEDPRKDKNAPMVKPITGSPTVPGEKLSPNGHRYVPLELPSALVVKPEDQGSAKKGIQEQPLAQGALPSLKERQLDQDDEDAPQVKPPTVATSPPTLTQDGEVEKTVPTETRPVCEEIGFASTSEYATEEFTLGGMSDSTYEYLPKQYVLLGGLVEKYRTMYEASAKTIKENLLFRPMLPDSLDVLIAGKLHVAPLPAGTPRPTPSTTLEPHQEHLTCFAGGMFGLGAKLFDRPEDLDIAIKMTEACIQNYNMTASGIMPEGFDVMPCDSVKSCEWNEAKYHDILDPRYQQRVDQYKEAMVVYEEQMSSASSWYEEQLLAMKTAAPEPAEGLASKTVAAATPTPVAGVLEKKKRQLDDGEDSKERKMAIGGHLGGGAQPPTKVTPADTESPIPSPTLPDFPSIYSPKVPATHEEYVNSRIAEERLPPGVTSMSSRVYILRPEAIESVWYMYRITGNPYYREAGWKMFEAVNAATTAQYGNSAIDDVTKKTPELKDEMESFWLAETMKYFYLLFADESVISLDEWVLNTEAHPFRRPS
ncbi:glycoside hydrolase family 47 protein [Periconia macrospinosa]|uniref:alpha-1,2-Mannosidase n=1 Tax=Periconia macrospinosa TaxID=97972 RepID=A0A2V1D0V5_9PLEO|nr:glycoside hydrolase family 47 protein [Periconia macrospinosa]